MANFSFNINPCFKLFLQGDHCREVPQYYNIFYFILFASPKKTNKQTNRQTERTLAGTPQQLWPITAGLHTNKKKIKTRNIKKHSDTRKTTATYNKLSD